MFAAVAVVAFVAFWAACDTLFPHHPEGESLYREHCADCHGVDGAGNTVKGMGSPFADLLDNNWKYGGDDGSMGNIIREGVFGSMPAYKEKLTDQQIRAIIGHIRVLRGEKTREVSP
ncbi:MAG TPA: c-type cytochrome [Thermoanaerobaculia bacterium]|nr:c-type cytochrome [Thermoanaerobaculia bacterium]